MDRLNILNIIPFCIRLPTHTHTQTRSWAADFSSIPALSIHEDWLSLALFLFRSTANSGSFALLAAAPCVFVHGFHSLFTIHFFILFLSAHRANWNRGFFTVNPFARLLRIEILICKCFAALPSAFYLCTRIVSVSWFSTELIPIVTNHS